MENIDYIVLLKRSWELVKNNRFLWGLGALAAFTEGGFNLSSGPHSLPLPPLSSPAPSPMATPSTLPSGLTPNTALGQFTGHVLGASTTNFDRFAQFWHTTPHLWAWIGAAVLIGLIVGIVVLYVSYSARAGLIHATDQLEKHPQAHKLGFKASFAHGRRFVGPLFALDVLITLAVLVVIGLFVGILFGLIFGLGTNPAWWLILLAVLTALVLIIVFVIFGFFINFIRLFGARMVVLQQLNPVEAFTQSYQLALAHWRNLILGVLAQAVAVFVASAVFAIAFLIIAFILAILSFVLWEASRYVGIAFMSVAALVGVALLWLFISIETAFLSSYWTLVYLAISYVDQHIKHSKE